MPKLQEQVDRHERQIAAIRNFIHEGMRLRVETRRDIRALAVVQKHTEETCRR